MRAQWPVLGLLGLALVAAGGCATRRAAEQVAFIRADRDQNGAVTRDELARYAAGLKIERADRDRDGALTLDEWRQADTGPEAEHRFADLDASGDNKVTRDELARAIARSPDLEVTFLELDQDRNGAIGQDELARGSVTRLFMIRF